MFGASTKATDELCNCEKRLLQVTVVISHELIYKRMWDPCGEVRSACRIRLFSWSGFRGVSAGGVSMRQAALNTLGRAAEPGSKAASLAIDCKDSSPCLFLWRQQSRQYANALRIAAVRLFDAFACFQSGNTGQVVRSLV